MIPFQSCASEELVLLCNFSYDCRNLEIVRNDGSLSTLVVITDTDGTLVGKTVSPEAADVDVHLWGAAVGEQEPGTENRLGQDVQNGVGDDLLIDVHLAAAISNTPDAIKDVSSCNKYSKIDRDLHWVDGPEDEGKGTDGTEEVANLATTSHGALTTANNELPDNDKVSDAGNGVPPPLLRSAFRAESGEKTGQHHDDIGDNGNKNVATVHAGQKSEIQEEEWGGQSPVDVTGPVDLAVYLRGGVWDVLVRLADGDVVVANTVTAGHGEVRQSREDGDHGGDDVVETLGLRDCQNA